MTTYVNSYNVYLNGTNLVMTTNSDTCWETKNTALNTLNVLGIKYTVEREEKIVTRMSSITINHNINIITKQLIGQE